ncbi:MAG: OmpA family protein [Bdellovibrionaceae bacterium]|nr:OmpA family protein [Pseudobdellovibrionaceae bacterium]
MIKLLSILAVLVAMTTANAQERFELGLGAGSTHPQNGEQFRTSTTTGDGNNFWLGYGFDENWGVELGLDNIDADIKPAFGTDTAKNQLVNLSGVYRFIPSSMIHPIAKLGLASVESKTNDPVTGAELKTTSLGGKLAAGFEADFKYLSLGALINFYHIAKSSDTPELKDTQLIQPAVFLTLHNALEADVKETSTSEAPAAAAPVAAKVVGDADKDGVNDDDDKCPNTPAGVVVNKIGCSEKEKASLRIDVLFDSGKATIKEGSEGVSKLADFMKKFPETNVEVAGHTDSLGDAKLNQKLSQQRADAVKAALVKEGVDASRLTAVGYGSSKPVADNKTKAGRDQNRRVNAEISVETDKKK